MEYVPNTRATDYTPAYTCYGEQSYHKNPTFLSLQGLVCSNYPYITYEVVARRMDCPKASHHCFLSDNISHMVFLLGVMTHQMFVAFLFHYDQISNHCLYGISYMKSFCTDFFSREIYIVRMNVFMELSSCLLLSYPKLNTLTPGVGLSESSP